MILNYGPLTFNDDDVVLVVTEISVWIKVISLYTIQTDAMRMIDCVSWNTTRPLRAYASPNVYKALLHEQRLSQT